MNAAQSARLTCGSGASSILRTRTISVITTRPISLIPKTSKPIGRVSASGLGVTSGESLQRRKLVMRRNRRLDIEPASVTRPGRVLAPLTAPSMRGCGDTAARLACASTAIEMATGSIGRTSITGIDATSRITFASARRVITATTLRVDFSHDLSGANRGAEAGFLLGYK